MKPVKTWVLLVVILFAALWTTLGILGLLCQNINEAKPVPGNEFPAVLDSKRHWQVLNRS
jgi:hypothetical protein